MGQWLREYKDTRLHGALNHETLAACAADIGGSIKSCLDGANA